MMIIEIRKVVRSKRTCRLTILP